jgi:RNA polymerase sigma-70 factor, ECF subfamily
MYSIHVAEKTRTSDTAFDWKEACLLFQYPEGKHMEGAEAYVGSEQGLNVADRQALARKMEELVSSRRALFYKRAYRVLGNAADAEDAVQDALFSAFKHLEQFRGEAQMSTWLTTIVSNCARMQLRKRVRQFYVSLEEPIGEEWKYCAFERVTHYGPDPEDECRVSELTARLRGLMAQLSPRLRKTFELRDLDGLSTSETADILGVPAGTVKAQLSRARAKLRKSLHRARSTRSGAPVNGTASPSRARK